MVPYQELVKLGEGTFGQVFRAKETETGRIVALKFIEKDGRSDQEIQILYREVTIMRKIHHPNIVTLLSSFQMKKWLVFVMEYAGGSNLLQALHDHGNFPEHQVQKFACQLLSAFHYLHSRRIIHRDVKTANTVLGDDGVVKLCDFGFASVLRKPTLKLTSQKGTPAFMSPERIRGEPYDHTADLWALGCTLFELHTGELPFLGESRHHLSQLILEGSVDWPNNMSASCKSFLRGLLIRDPEKRLSWPLILAHPFVAGGAQFEGNDETETSNESSYEVSDDDSDEDSDEEGDEVNYEDDDDDETSNESSYEVSDDDSDKDSNEDGDEVSYEDDDDETSNEASYEVSDKDSDEDSDEDNYEDDDETSDESSYEVNDEDSDEDSNEESDEDNHEDDDDDETSNEDNCDDNDDGDDETSDETSDEDSDEDNNEDNDEDDDEDSEETSKDTIDEDDVETSNEDSDENSQHLPPKNLAGVFYEGNENRRMKLKNLRWIRKRLGLKSTTDRTREDRLQALSLKTDMEILHLKMAKEIEAVREDAAMKERSLHREKENLRVTLEACVGKLAADLQAERRKNALLEQELQEIRLREEVRNRCETALEVAETHQVELHTQVGVHQNEVREDNLERMPQSLDNGTRHPTSREGAEPVPTAPEPLEDAAVPEVKKGSLWKTAGICLGLTLIPVAIAALIVRR